MAGIERKGKIETLNIKIKSTFYFPGVPDRLEIAPGTLLRDVLWGLFEGTHFEREVVDKIDGRITIDDTWEVRVNDILSYSLPQDLDTELHDGDVITLSIIMIGGG